MTKVVVDISMSLDGYVAGPNDGPDNGLGDGGMQLHDWFFKGSTPSRRNEFFKISAGSEEIFEEMFETTGSFVSGRRTYDLAGGWGGDHPFHVPFFVVTHHPPENPIGGDMSMATFVTDGVASAIAQARDVAATKNVMIGSPSIIHQALAAGLVDDVQIHLVPVLLNGGIRLFDRLGPDSVRLERTRVVDAQGVTHLRYRVVK
jgi:dihydrofolate reductase